MMQGGSHLPIYIKNTGVQIQRYSETREHNPCLFNLNQLGAGHDVRVSNTMIKVTYNKEIKNHSMKSINGSEFPSKRHSVTFKPTLPSNFNTNSSNKNHNRGFSDIVIIPSHAKMAYNRANLHKAFQKSNKEHCPLPVTEQKQCVIAHKAFFHKNTGAVKANELDNQNCDKLQNAKQIKVCLTRINVLDPKENPESVVSNIAVKEEHEKYKSSINSGVNVKNFIKHDNVNKTKDLSINSIMGEPAKKDKMTKYECSDIVNELLKAGKSKNVALKKKRSASSESFKHLKKLKTDSIISHKQFTEKAVLHKLKEKDKKLKLPSDVKVAKSNKVVNCNQSANESPKKHVLHDDPNLPPGWKRIIKYKHCGTELKHVVCIASPEGRKFYFKAGLKNYLEKTKSPLTIDDFHFGLYSKDETGRRSCKSYKKLNDTKVEDKQNLTKKEKSKLDPATLVENNGNTDDTFKVEKLDENSQKKFLLVDPDLPPGWTRKIRLRVDGENSNRFQVCVISPEGRRFKRKYLLHKHLTKIRSSLDINQFYFGIFPKKMKAKAVSAVERNKESSFKLTNNSQEKDVADSLNNSINKSGSCDNTIEDMCSKHISNIEYSCDSPVAKELPLMWTKSDDVDIYIDHEQPMLIDTTLPPGWRRYIKVISTGESAGKIEVVIVSPGGRRHKSKGSLKHYIEQRGLEFNVDDFDFSVFGRNVEKYSSTPLKLPQDQKNIRKRNSLLLPSDTSFPNLNFEHPSLHNEGNKTREALMINYVSGLMLNCGLRELRTERRLRIPREEQEKILKNYLDSENEAFKDESEIPINWIRKLITCRSDFAEMDVDAISTVASLTKVFLQGLTRGALAISDSENSVEYNDVAELIDKSQCLSPLKTLIPKKITFREFISLNRPKKFTSFT